MPEPTLKTKEQPAARPAPGPHYRPGHPQARPGQRRELRGMGYEKGAQHLSEHVRLDRLAEAFRQAKASGDTAGMEAALAGLRAEAARGSMSATVMLQHFSGAPDKAPPADPLAPDLTAARAGMSAACNTPAGQTVQGALARLTPQAGAGNRYATLALRALRRSRAVPETLWEQQAQVWDGGPIDTSAPDPADIQAPPVSVLGDLQIKLEMIRTLPAEIGRDEYFDIACALGQATTTPPTSPEIADVAGTLRQETTRRLSTPEALASTGRNRAMAEALRLNARGSDAIIDSYLAAA